MVIEVLFKKKRESKKDHVVGHVLMGKPMVETSDPGIADIAHV